MIPYSPSRTVRSAISAHGNHLLHLECYKVTGDYDYMLKVVAPDLQTFSLFMTKRLMQAPGIVSVKSAVTLGEVKYTTALPIESMR